NYYSDVPSIGASGAIAGVLGAYVVSYPGARVLTLVPIFIFIQFIEIPALIVLGFWFIMQFFYGAAALAAATANTGGVAWWGHVGGFLLGMILVGLFPRKDPPRYEYTWRSYTHPHNIRDKSDRGRSSRSIRSRLSHGDREQNRTLEPRRSAPGIPFCRIHGSGE